jgi:hypothetical protein
MRDAMWRCDTGRKKKAFFSEEKKQKTFMSLSRICPDIRDSDTKVSWFSFSRKNCFLVQYFVMYTYAFGAYLGMCSPGGLWHGENCC